MSPNTIGSLVEAGIPIAFGALLIMSGFSSRNTTDTVEENPSAGSGWMIGFGFVLIAFGIFLLIVGHN